MSGKNRSGAASIPSTSLESTHRHGVERQEGRPASAVHNSRNPLPSLPPTLAKAFSLLTSTPLALPLLCALVCTQSACQQQVFEPVRDGLVATAVLKGEVKVLNAADLLFVVDDSPSMANKHDKLAAAFPELAELLDQLDPPVDWRVAVMTTSVDERFGSCKSSDPTAPQSCSAAFGGTGFRCQGGACVRNFKDKAGKLVSRSGNPKVLDRSQNSRSELIALFQQNVRVGLDGSRHEQPLRALRLAFENGRLNDFWRPDARLVVVVASDEDDCSDSSGEFVALYPNSGGYADQCDEAARIDDSRLDSINAWVRDFQQLPVPGGHREVAFSAITGLAKDGQQPGMCTDEDCAEDCENGAGFDSCDTACSDALRPERCRDECLLECRQFCGSQVPGRRLARTARALGGSLSSICEPSFGPALAKLASVMGIPERLELPSVPRDGRALFFRVFRGDKEISCEEGRDYRLELEDEPARLEIEQGGRCRLYPDDRWELRYVAE